MWTMIGVLVQQRTTSVRLTRLCAPSYSRESIDNNLSHPCPAPPEMTGLLELPREVRDAIIERVLLCPNTVEPSPSASFTPLDDVQYKSWLKGRGVFYDPAVREPNAVSLLRVNRQIHSETRDALDRLPGNNYSIKLVFFQEKHIYVHWTLVPVKATKLDTVNVTVSIEDHIVDDEGGYGRGRKYACRSLQYLSIIVDIARLVVSGWAPTEALLPFTGCGTAPLNVFSKPDPWARRRSRRARSPLSRSLERPRRMPLVSSTDTSPSSTSSWTL